MFFLSLIWLWKPHTPWDVILLAASFLKHRILFIKSSMLLFLVTVFALARVVCTLIADKLG